MHIAFIRPSLGVKGRKSYTSLAFLEPLTFAVLAALTPRDVQISFFDERIDEVPLDRRFDLVAISVETYVARRAYEISSAFRKNGIPVVMGGFHPTLVPDEAAIHCDSVVVGEAEETWGAVLEDARRKALRRVYRGSDRPRPSSYPCDRSVFGTRHYLPLRLVQFRRGCIHSCEFCAVRTFYRDSAHGRDVDDVIKEMRSLGSRFVFFVDDNLAADRESARELLSRMKGMGVRWTAQVTLDVAGDPEFLDLMKESGCLCLILGLESLDSGNLRRMKKDWMGSALPHLERSLREIKQRGILVYATFIFGYDNDDPGVFARTVDFAIEQKLFLANFNMLQPFPGTALYRRLEEQGRLIYPCWWLDPAYRWDLPAFKPVGMTPEALREGCAFARRRFNSISGMVRRSLDFHANLGDLFRSLVFFSGNLVSRHDICHKQGLRLGFQRAAAQETAG